MRGAFTAVSGLIFAAALVLGGVSTAMTRAHAQVYSDVVICSDQGNVTLTLDADGTPVQAARHCPECTVTFSMLPAFLPAVVPEQQASPARWAVVPQRIRTRAVSDRHARAPPAHPA